MRRYIAVLALLGALVCLGVFAGAIMAGPGPVRAIVTFDAVNEAAHDQLLDQFGAVKVKDLDLINGKTVLLPNKAAIGRLAAKAGVKSVEEDRLVSIVGRSTPDGSGGKNPPPPPLLAPPAPSQTVDWGVDQTESDLVWPNPAGSGVNVAVLDTGIQLDHPDLQANIAGGFNAISSGRSANDDNGHGTHVAGTIAAVDNGIGYKGAAYEVNLFAVKVLSKSGMGWTSDIVEGLQWAIANDIDVINMSYGASSASIAERAAIEAAHGAGITLVAAAGNSGGAVGYPAAYPDVIAVSAVDSSLNIASFSSRGPEVELAAPGVNISSTYKGSSYRSMNGTSMASPHVVGVAALVIQAHSLNKDPDQVRAKLANANDLGDPGRDSLFGYGLVDASRAVSAP